MVSYFRFPIDCGKSIMNKTKGIKAQTSVYQYGGARRHLRNSPISRKSDQNCGRDSARVARGAHDRCDVIKYANELNHKRAQLDH